MSSCLNKLPFEMINRRGEGGEGGIVTWLRTNPMINVSEEYSVNSDSRE